MLFAERAERETFAQFPPIDLKWMLAAVIIPLPCDRPVAGEVLSHCIIHYSVINASPKRHEQHLLWVAAIHRKNKLTSE